MKAEMKAEMLQTISVKMYIYVYIYIYICIDIDEGWDTTNYIGNYIRKIYIIHIQIYTKNIYYTYTNIYTYAYGIDHMYIHIHTNIYTYT
jgi:hypothetical protein